jgi:hypothetical protein
MSTPQAAFISIALTRLRRGVGLCCWLAAVSLIAQLLVFGVAAFMDVRRTTLEDQTTPATVVSAAAAQRAAPLGSADAQPLESPAEARTDAADEAINPNVVLTGHDRVLNKISGIAMTTGMIAMVLMLPLLLAGVMLSAASATPGVENVVSSFMWSLLVGLFLLPVGGIVGLPWQHGGLVPYDFMTQQVDMQMVDGQWGAISFHTRFVLLPLACLVGVGLVGFRFSSGVFAGIIPKEDMRLDPVLEREAANVKAGSLMGGRTAAALRNMNTAPPTPPATTAVTPSGAGEVKPGMLQATAGEVPRRLI